MGLNQQYETTIPFNILGIICFVNSEKKKADFYNMKKETKDIKKEIKPLSQAQDGIYSLNVKDYFKYYALDLGDKKTEHLFGSFQSGEFTLAAHLFIPKDYKATVFILHGFLGHCGLLNKLIKELIDANFAVAVFDLPGHGLSSGQPTAIDDFAQYTQSLDDFLKIVKTRLHGPYHIIGHSTGAAVIMDYLLEEKEDCFDKVILAAPLEHSNWWTLSKICFSISRFFCDNLPRIFSKVSSDRDFLRFIKYKDPLQSKKVSIKWINAMFNWDKRITEAKPFGRKVFIIQGTKDNIIDWRYNIKFIQSKFKNCRVEYIKNGRHELFNESEKIRQEVFSLIRSCLEK